MFGLSIPLNQELFPTDATSIRPEDESSHFSGPSSTIWIENKQMPGLWVACHANLSSLSHKPGKILNMRGLGLNLTTVQDPGPNEDLPPAEVFSLFGFTAEDKQANTTVPMMNILHNKLLHPGSAKVIKKFQQDHHLAVNLSVSRSTPTKNAVRTTRDNNTVFCTTGSVLNKNSDQTGPQALQTVISVTPRDGEEALLSELQGALKRFSLLFLGINMAQNTNILDLEVPVDPDYLPAHLPFFGFEEGKFPREQQMELLAGLFFDKDGTEKSDPTEQAEHFFKGRVISKPRSFFEEATKDAQQFRNSLLQELGGAPAATRSEAHDESTAPFPESNVQPGSVILLAESLRLIREESLKIGKMDFSDLETSAKDKKLIETLNARLDKAAVEADVLRADKKNLDLTVEKLNREAKDAGASTHKQLSQLQNKHRDELMALAAQEEEARRPLLEQIDDHQEAIRKLTVSRDGFRAAASAEFDDDQLSYISGLATAKESEVRDASDLSILLSMENEDHRRKIVQLEAKLSWYRKQNAEASVLEQTEGIGEFEAMDTTPFASAFKSNLDLCNYVDENFKHLSISRDAFAPAKSLDGFERSKSWAKKALGAFLALNEYAEKMAKGEISASFVDYASSPDARYPLQRHKIAMESANTGTKSKAYRRSRTFAVNENADWSGDQDLECYPHIRIDQARPGPRIYFSDDTIDSTGKIFVGYYGEHLPNMAP